MTSSEANVLWQYCTVCQVKESYSKDGSGWQTHSMYNAYFIQHSFYLHHPPPFVLSHCPSYYYSVAFQGRCAQVLQIYGNRKLTDPYFQEKIWPFLSPSFWVHTTSKCSDKSSCSQTKAPCEKLCFCFEMKILPFSGILSEVRSIVEITKEVQSKILDHKFLKLWTYQAPSPLLSLFRSARRSWYTSIVHSVLTSRVYCFFVFFYLFQILIDHYPLSKE